MALTTANTGATAASVVNGGALSALVFEATGYPIAFWIMAVVASFVVRPTLLGREDFKWSSAATGIIIAWGFAGLALELAGFAATSQNLVAAACLLSVFGEVAGRKVMELLPDIVRRWASVKTNPEE